MQDKSVDEHSEAYHRALEHLAVGDRVKVRMPSYKGNNPVTYQGVIKGIYDRFALVYTGKYHVTVHAGQLICGEAKVEKIA